MVEKRTIVRFGVAALVAIVIGMAAAFVWFGFRLWKIIQEAQFIFAPIVSDSQDKDAVKILFIANSLTFQHMVPAAVSESIKTGLKKTTKVWQIVVPGQSLAGHWKTGNAQRLIVSKGPWDYVILQPASGEVFQDVESMRLFAKRFHDVIDKAHAKTILFETFADKSEIEKQTIITKAYRRIGEELNAQVIPVGQAFFYLQARDKNLNLYEADNHHPSQCGTVLTSCIIFEYLFDKDPHGLPATVVFRTPTIKGEFTPIDLPKNQAREIEDIAWEFYKQNRPPVTRTQ